MDYDRAHQLYLKGLFTDLKLELFDGSNTITMNLHKIILITHSVYFEKLLTFGENSSNITINVPNVNIARSIILSFYGQKYPNNNLNWAQQLAVVKCRDYFALETFLDKIPEEIAEESYDYFLEICCIIGFDEDLIKTLAKNLPKDYDLSRLGTDLIKKMVECSTLYINIVHGLNFVSLVDLVTNHTITTFSNIRHTEKTILSPNTKYLAIISENEYCRIFATDGKILFEKDDCENVVFSPNNLHCAIHLRQHLSYIKIIDLATGSHIRMFDTRSSLYKLAYAPSNEYFVTLHSMNYTTRIYNGTTYDFLYEIKLESTSYQILFDIHSTCLVMGSYGQNTHIYDLKTSIKKYSDKDIIKVSFVCPLYIPGSFINPAITKRFLAIKNGANIEIYDIDKNSTIKTFTIKNYEDIIFSPMSTHLMIDYGEKNIIEVYNLLTDTCMKIPFEYFYYEFSLDDKFLALYDKTHIHVFDLISNIFLYKIPCEGEYIKSIEFTPDNKYLAFCIDEKIRVYERVTGLEVNSIDRYSEPIIYGMDYSGIDERLLKIIEKDD